MRRGAGVVTTVVILLALLAAGDAGAAKLPDWAREIAAAAPERPDGLSEHASRVLLSETRLQVEPDGTLTIRRRRAEQALSNAADEVGIGRFFFDDRTKVVTSKGWHLPPGGSTEKSRRKDAVDLAVSDSFTSDQQGRYVAVSDIDRGSLVFFEFEARREPYQLGFREFFHESVPTETMRFVVELPPDWTMRYAWLHRPGPEPAVSDGRWVWTVEQPEVTEPEPLAPSSLELAPLLVLGFTPPPDATVAPASLEDWTALAGWYERLAAGLDEVTPDVERVAAELADGAADDFFSRVRLAGNYVRDRVRYVAKEMGIEGYRPRPAATVLTNLYGDCKDKSTLLRALLAASGERSYPILIHNGLDGNLSDEVPDLHAFNHLVVGVAVPQDIEAPPDFAPAIVEAGEVGRLLIVDTTDEYNSIGWLPASLAGKRGLVVAGERSTLVTLPAGDPRYHRIERRLDVEIEPDGSVSQRLVTTRYGDPAAAARHAYSSSAREYEEAVERELLELWPASSLDSFEVEEETAAGGFEQTSTITIEAPNDPRHAELLAFFPEALAGLPRVSLRRRERPVQYPHAVTLSYETTIRGVPDGVVPPEARPDEGDGWTVAAEFEREGDLLRGRWELALARTRFEVADLDELKEIWRAARRAASFSVPRGDGAVP
jgi:hypothetical protein